MFPPAVSDPQFMELREVVQALFEYTPKFAEVVTCPLDGRLWEVVMAAKVVNVKAIAIRTKIITDAVTESFIFGVFVPPQNTSCILSLNKHYYHLFTLCI
jgi:hypothetical protein